MTGTVHVQPVFRPVRRPRQFTVGPVQRAHDIGAVADPAEHGGGQQVAATLNQTPQGKLSTRIRAGEQDDGHALLVAALQHP